MFKEFRVFLLRGNVIDLAIAFIAGVAFTAVVNSFVADVLMQGVAAIAGKPDFSGLAFTINDSTIRYGAFLTVLVNFVLTMAAVFFLLVKPVNAFNARFADDVEAAPRERECPECLGTVPAAARRCQLCTSELSPVA